MSYKISDIILALLGAPLLIMHLIIYFIMPERELLKQDISHRRHLSGIKSRSTLIYLIQLLILKPEFRYQFNLRAGRLRHFILFCKGNDNCEIQGAAIGPGFVLLHGLGCVVNPNSIIGENCIMLHGVTIGDSNGANPIIGDNVTIGAGAIIIGGIKIGNNVKIGAGAIVVNDVPDNATVICDKAKIIVRNNSNESEESPIYK